MKLWILNTFCAASLLILSGCTAKPVPNKEAVIDSTLPIIELTKNGVIVDTNAVAFEWGSITDQRVKGIYIYKQSPESAENKLDYYDTIGSRFATHYTDTNILPDTRYKYAFKTFSKEAESKQSKSRVLNSLPVIDSVAWIQSIQDMPRSAKIIWRPHTNQKVKTYIIERKSIEDDDWIQIATVEGRLNAEFIDMDLKDKFTYKYRVRVLTFDDITSVPSQIVKVVTKALPAAVTDITATKDLPKKIDLLWAKSKTPDFSHYNVYRSESLNGSYDLIGKIYNNHFSDKIQEDGKQYFYKISVVDKDDLESKFIQEPIYGSTLIKPTAPSSVELKFVNNKVELTWSNSDDRTKSYIVEKRYKKGWFEEITDSYKVSTTKYVDSSLLADTEYF